MAKTPKTTDETTQEKVTKNKIAKKVYMQSDGSESSHATAETVSLEFRFADGETIPVTRDDIGDGCQTAAFWHGLSQKLGDSYAGTANPTEAREGNDKRQGLFTVLELLKLNDWVRPGTGGGPRPSMLIDAILAAIEAAGKDVTDEIRENVRGMVKTPEDRKKALLNPQVSAQYERVRADRAASKAEAAQKSADETAVDLSEFTGENAD